MLEPGRQARSNGDCPARGADEPDADEEHDPDADERPGSVAEQGGEDLPGIARGRPHGIGLDEVVDDVVAGDAARNEDERAGDDRSDRESAHDRAAPVAREPDRERRETAGRTREPTEGVQELGDVLCRLQLRRRP